MRFLGVLAGAFLLLHPAAICARTVRDMPTEYPANATPGVGPTAFTKHVAEPSAGKVTIKPSTALRPPSTSFGIVSAPPWRRRYASLDALS
jgi:hypothetical protein